jgi:8-oxo-dGTP pyrophosphatase MutT (NUDIX family)
VIQAAGILFVTPDRLALFVKRGNGSDHPLEWCIPGGKREEGETMQACAIRETLEETGCDAASLDIVLHTRSIAIAEEALPPAMPSGAVEELSPSVTAPEPAIVVAPSEDVDFTTYLARIDDPFMVTLCDEHTGWAWASLDDPPEPMHPGVRVALARLAMDELGVARAIAAGELVSPQVYENMSLFALRITGTGVAFRSSIGEFVLRDPQHYLNQYFLDRCAGLQVILEHPEGATLDGKEFINRTIGSVMFAYIKGDEVWGIAKIYDDDAIWLLDKKKASTSPTVVFKDPSVNTKVTLEDGSPLLIEGRPSLLDHIAVLPEGAGVWDKGGELAGVDQTGTKVFADSQPVSTRADGLDPDKLRSLDLGLQLIGIRMSNYAAQRRI